MKYCWSCGAELRGTNPQFCSECGIKLDDGKPTPTPTRTVGGTGNVNVTITNSFREAHRLYQINEYELALTYIDDAIEEDSENYNYYNLKALILKQLHRFDEHAKMVDKSLKIKENLEARYMIAFGLAMGEDKLAIELYMDAESNYEGNAEYYAKLASLYYIISDYNQAIKAADKSLSIDSKNGLGHFYKGCANAAKENFKLSNSSFEQALKYLDISSEEYPAIYFFRTYNFIGMMNEFLERNNQNILPMLSQAVKDSQEGYKIFSAHYNKNKEFVFLNFSLDLIPLVLNYLVQNNYFFVDFHSGFGIKVAHSLQDITDEYIKLRSQNTIVLKMKGDIYGRLGFHDKAVECFDAVLKTKDPDFRVLGYKGRSLLELGRIQEAENCLKQMYIFLEDEISRDPRNIYLIREKAVTLAQLGRKRDALKCYDEILRIDPTAPFVEQDKINIMRM